MKGILNGNDLQICSTKKYLASRDRIIAAVDMHRRAIQLVNYVNQSIHAVHISHYLYCNIISDT